GINTAIFSTSGGYQGIGFAISSNMVKNVMESILNQGKVVRGWLGVHIQTLTPELMKQFDLKDEKGVLLADVEEGGPAEKSGIKKGDVITGYNGKKVESPAHLRNAVASTKPGTTVIVKLLRNGETMTLNVTVGELPGELQTATATTFDNVLNGVSVHDLTEQILQELGITRKIKGVVVINVAAESPSHGILTKGDVIVEVNKKSFQNAKEFKNIVSTIKKEQSVLLRVIRGKTYQYITISPR
ncbi:MAG: PDZ domain-containing protein, partial [Nitrospirae bacterium]|nr:PDZ domain-containing protein [Nitrospirota bacterium]